MHSFHRRLNWELVDGSAEPQRGTCQIAKGLRAWRATLVEPSNPYQPQRGCVELAATTSKLATSTAWYGWRKLLLSL
jgi:hypothetical protein